MLKAKNWKFIDQLPSQWPFLRQFIKKMLNIFRVSSSSYMLLYIVVDYIVSI